MPVTQKNPPIRHPVKRLILSCIGLCIMAFGVAFSIRAELGTSPISSVPYVTAMISGLTVGETTIIVNLLFIVIELILLRRQFGLRQVLQIPTTLLFGSMIDVADLVLQPLSAAHYIQQWALCLTGIVVLALGISVEITANLVTTAGEGLVLAICRSAPIQFSTMKVIFDVTLVCLAIVLSLVYFGRLDGVRERTVAAAILVGLITRHTSRLTKKLEAALLN